MNGMDPVSDAVKVAVVGVGRMGQRHARVYQQIPEADLVAVVDEDVQRAQTLAQELGCASTASVDQLLADHPDLAAASIAVPTVLHEEAARPFIQRGIACLIEKPLAPTTQEARTIAALAAKHGATLQVGHTERFNPAVRAVADLSLTPRFMEVHRVSPMTFRSLDIGVVMDMMIHDLDIVLTLARSPLEKVDAAGVAVLGKHEDVANARLQFASGCVANLTASRLALKTDRRFRLFSEDAYVSLDYARRSGILIRKSENADVLAGVRQQLSDGADLADVDYSQLVQIDELTMGGDHDPDPLTAQLQHFLDTVRRGGRPLVDAEAGFVAVDAAQRIIASLRSHHWEGLAGLSV